MPAEHAAVEIDDVAGLDRVRPQAADDVGVAAGRHEADVLAVLLVGDLETEATRQFARLGLGHVAERKAQVIELLARGREQEIALVAIGIGGADQRARSVGEAARGDIMAGGERRGAELARGREQIAELDRAVALDARHRRFARARSCRRNCRSPIRESGSRSRARNAGCRSARRHCGRRGCRARRSRRPCDGSRRHDRRAAA